MPKLRRRGYPRDGHARHLRRFELVFHPLRESADGQAIRPDGGREMASLRAIYWRGRACDPAPALRPFLDTRARTARPDRPLRAIQGPLYPGDGDPRDLP